MKSFNAIIQSNDTGGAWVDVPFDVEKEYGKKRVKVKATFDGVEYRGSMVRMGSDCHMLLLRKDIRAKIGKQPGDEISVTVEEDLEPRVVVVPEDLKQAMNAFPGVVAFFEKLSYTHQKEYVQWIESAKREGTRIRRIQKAVTLMQSGQKGI